MISNKGRWNFPPTLLPSSGAPSVSKWRPNVAGICGVGRISQRGGSLNLLSARRTASSLPNKLLTPPGLSRLSVAVEIECPSPLFKDFDLK